MFVFAVVFLIIALLQYLEKGMPLNNIYIYATKKERERIDAKPLFRQSAIIFMLSGMMCAMLAFNMATGKQIFVTLGFAFASGIVIYTMSSSKEIRRQAEEQRDGKKK